MCMQQDMLLCGLSLLPAGHVCFGGYACIMLCTVRGATMIKPECKPTHRAEDLQAMDLADTDTS